MQSVLKGTLRMEANQIKAQSLLYVHVLIIQWSATWDFSYHPHVSTKGLAAFQTFSQNQPSQEISLIPPHKNFFSFKFFLYNINVF